MNELTISKLQTILPKPDEIKRQNADSAASPFSDYIKQSLEDVNSRMLDADHAIDDLVTGKNQDIHNTMISMQKAEISFELVMQIRNKIISAYDEVRKDVDLISIELSWFGIFAWLETDNDQYCQYSTVEYKPR